MENLEKKPNNFEIWLAEFLKKYFGIVLFLVALSVAVLGYFLVISPHFQASAILVQSSSFEQEKKYIQIVQKLTDLKSMEKAYKKIDSDVIRKTEEFLPPEYVQEQLFLELEQVIIKNGYTVNSMAIQKELGVSGDVPDSSVGRVKVSLKVSAVDYQDFKKLLSIVETNIRLMNVNKLTFSPSDQSASFDFFTYFLRDK
jgi:Tfp pilus assembly protein PilO